MTIDLEHCRAVAKMITDLCEEVELLRKVANCAGCRSENRTCELLGTQGEKCWRKNLHQEPLND